MPPVNPWGNWDIPPGEMKFKYLDTLMICISFERVFHADQQSYNNHTLKINILRDISIRSKTNDVIDYVMATVKLTKYVFRTYHSKGNLMLISNCNVAFSFKIRHGVYELHHCVFLFIQYIICTECSCTIGYYIIWMFS